jgi:dihydroorotase
MDQIFRAISLNPAKRLGISGGSLNHSEPADLIIFDSDKPFILERERLHSKVKNTPFDGQKLQGRVLKTFIQGREVFSL